MITKTGECYFRDEEGKLFIAESFVNEETGEVWTTIHDIPEE